MVFSVICFDDCMKLHGGNLELSETGVESKIKENETKRNKPKRQTNREISCINE